MVSEDGSDVHIDYNCKNYKYIAAGKSARYLTTQSVRSFAPKRQLLAMVIGAYLRVLRNVHDIVSDPVRALIGLVQKTTEFASLGYTRDELLLVIKRMARKAISRQGTGRDALFPYHKVLTELYDCLQTLRCW